MLPRAVVDDEVDDDRDAALVRGRHEGLEVVGRAVVGLDRSVVGDVVAVIAGRLGDRHQPEAGDAEIVVGRRVAVVEVVEALREPAQVADTVAVRVGETSDEHLVEDAVGPPRDGRRDRGDLGTGRRAGARRPGSPRRSGCGRRRASPSTASSARAGRDDDRRTRPTTATNGREDIAIGVSHRAQRSRPRVSVDTPTGFATRRSTRSSRTGSPPATASASPVRSSRGTRRRPRTASRAATCSGSSSASTTSRTSASTRST